VKAIKASATRCLPHRCVLPTCDNSGAKMIRISSVVHHKTVKGRYESAGIADLVMGSVIVGKPDMRKQVVFAVVVRTKKEFRRQDGVRVQFEDNACVVVKDRDGSPKGTMVKGPIAKEAADRWPAVAKIASMII